MKYKIEKLFYAVIVLYYLNERQKNNGMGTKKPK